ncbi:glycoside hydrolase family 3 N-terminal domain-containing protein [Lutibacter sp. TH_r2]|uniref:glycoside hydrolase family 3 N-terminal domain-containing protein n=1 Tax=Lutibacter sp. TH_r2 TaxID=3082083 RepID=UPI0029555721|nr:glycoside hydrolase family 3 N-terminal domain-containing protein [Lutibacter sp. TH_r2]MDV7188006.1 glycoside hydrolase family 3 N-terminal domain-containing protein [Lutibacter sp. TH_r2]
MNFLKKLTYVLLTLLLACNTTNNEVVETVKTAPFSTPEIDKKVDDLMSKMSMDEKLAQIQGTRIRDIMVDGKISVEKFKEHIPYGIGHFCQFSSGQDLEPNELRDLVREIQHLLVTETRLKIPAIFHEEAITGFATKGATTFPQQIGVACTWNPELVTKMTKSTSVSMRAAGATFALSPMLDISRSAHFNRHQESYGEDAYLTSKMGVSFVKGLQGDDFRTGVAATVKHFAGYGTANNNSKELYEEYLMPHEACIKIGGAKSVMPSYGVYKTIPVVANQIMLDRMLRREIGFDGLIVSDYGSINMLYKKYKVAKDSVMAGAMALNAGVDIELSSPTMYPKLDEALAQGHVTAEQINTAVKRSLIMKARLGLLDKNPTFGKDGNLDFDPPENRKLAYETASQSIVLLKNNGVLPIKNDVKKIALVGPNAAAVHGLLGDYTYQGMRAFWKQSEFDSNNPKLVTLKEGLENRLGKNVQLSYERGCDWSAKLEAKIDKKSFGDSRIEKLKLLTIKDQPQPDLQNALKISNDSDVIIAAMGENLYLNGEGRWRNGIGLPGQQEAFVQKLIATGKPVILVMFSGRQEEISKLEGKCAAIIQAWFPGEEGGNAVADILLGNVNPSGKLCVSYPKTQEKVEINYKDGYPNKALIQYPFGYGLSYSTFEYSDFKMDTKSNLTDTRFSISLNLKNTSKVDGDEIVQLYVSPVNSNSAMKPIQLKGFERVSLKAGEEKTVTFNVSPQQLAQYKNNEWIIESGEYVFKIGASCTDIKLSGTIDLQGEDVILTNGRQVFFTKNEIK